MFDPNADIAVVISELYREAYRRAVAKIASRQLGEAWIDLDQPEFKEAA